jgi:hypothetical protein
MLPRTCVALLLLSACATTEPGRRRAVAPDRRLANLRRAATLPWVDDGRCAVREASGEWGVLVERCFHALDLERIRFRDVAGRCHLAQVGEVAMVGACILAGPEIAGAVIIVGSALVVAYAIHEALEAYERGTAPERVQPVVRAPSGGNQPWANRRPVPEPEGSQSGKDVFPPKPPDTSDPPDRDQCIPRPALSHLGGDELHNFCADNVPGNAFRKVDVLVNGKAFDALQPLTRTLWEIKTDDFDNYSPPLKGFAIDKEVLELKRERELAHACGFELRIGVRSAAHKEALGFAAPELKPLIVIMDWC